MMFDVIKKLMDSMGGKFSSELGINLAGSDPAQVFKWFLASKLFGARISTDIAIRTFRKFEKNNITSPEEILKTSWDGLVRILDEGGYVRYDFSTATKLLAIMEDLKRNYRGNLNDLHESARDERELEHRLKGLGKGIGDVTVNIFLRELRMVWPKAKPHLSNLVKLACEHIGFLKPGEGNIKDLEMIWSEYRFPGRDVCDFEAALLRLGKDYCKKEKCKICPMEKECKCQKV